LRVSYFGRTIYDGNNISWKLVNTKDKYVLGIVSNEDIKTINFKFKDAIFSAFVKCSKYKFLDQVGIRKSFYINGLMLPFSNVQVSIKDDIMISNGLAFISK
jgi:hypothetical protein